MLDATNITGWKSFERCSLAKESNGGHNPKPQHLQFDPENLPPHHHMWDLKFKQTLHILSCVKYLPLWPCLKKSPYEV